MPFLELNNDNASTSTTVVTAGPPDKKKFDGQVVFAADAHAILALPPLANQDIDALYGRGINGGGGVIGEGGDGGPGVVGVAGANSKFGEEHSVQAPPAVGRGVKAGVLGVGPVGVQGQSENGPGVRGHTDFGNGVEGQSSADTLSGVSGLNLGDGPGVTGTSVNGDGVVGVSNKNNKSGVVGLHLDRGSAIAGFSKSGVGVLGVVPPPPPPPGGIVQIGGHPTLAGRFIGPVLVEGEQTITGNLYILGDQIVLGNKHAAVPHADGTHRLLYSVESPESWFEDFGEGNLIKGKATVRLAPDFAAVVKTDTYHVFLTPYGDSNGLYVTGREDKGFEVREQKGGTGKLTFSYRVVAQRKDVTATRFPKIRVNKIDLPTIPLPKTELPTVPTKPRPSRRRPKPRG